MSPQFSRSKRFNAIKYLNTVRVLTKEIDNGKALPEFFYLRGKAYSLLSMNKKASSDFEKASRLKPESLKYRKMLAASLLISEDYEKCLDLLKACPEKPFFMLIKGTCLYKSGKPGEAMKILDRYLERAPLDSAGYYQKARCLMALERFSEAGAEFRKSLRLGGDAIEGLSWLALSVVAQEREEGGIADMPMAA
ncbi:MAG: tetratricopeptide repeat protein [Nitrospirota bacterium]